MISYSFYASASKWRDLYPCRKNRVTAGTVQKWRIQTHSSADIKRGFIYSKPSNSDWSIFFTISLLRLKTVVNLARLKVSSISWQFVFYHLDLYNRLQLKTFPSLFCASLSLQLILFSSRPCNSNKHTTPQEQQFGSSQVRVLPQNTLEAFPKHPVFKRNWKHWDVTLFLHY